MDVTFLEEWTRALRSGNYKQGREKLKQQENDGITVTDSFCCLGVAVDIVRPGQWIQHEEDIGGEDDPLVYYDTEYTDGGDLLSESMLEEIGMNVRQQGVFAALNDHGCSFEEIADVASGIIYDLREDVIDTNTLTRYQVGLEKLIEVQRAV
jgi:hypothetical protein